MTSIFIYHHLGLGDHFVCEGLVRHLTIKFQAEKVFLPVKKHNYYSVSSIYSDLPCVILLPVDGDSDVYSLPEVALSTFHFKVGFERTVPKGWDRSFYSQLNIPFHYRYSFSNIVRNGIYEMALVDKLINNLHEINQPFILVANGSSNGNYKLNIESSLPQVFVQPISNSIVDWVGVIERAEEVHVIDSSFFHLCQSFYTILPKCYYHLVRETHDILTCDVLPCWNIVDYKQLANTGST